MLSIIVVSFPKAEDTHQRPEPAPGAACHCQLVHRGTAFRYNGADRATPNVPENDRSGAGTLGVSVFWGAVGRCDRYNRPLDQVT
ncbi:MAG: hypothetical protein D6741_09520 [Planctomycetota bacterium]|nr:MAG: hypothetical protein D6741_09520 [Planctomycetota bacterium]